MKKLKTCQLMVDCAENWDQNFDPKVENFKVSVKTPRANDLRNPSEKRPLDYHQNKFQCQNL